MLVFVQVSEQIPQGDGCGSYTFVCYESRQPSKSSVVFAFANFKVADLDGLYKCNMQNVCDEQN